MRNNRKILLLAVLSLVITISFNINCTKENKEKSVRNSDDPKYVWVPANEVDPDYEKTFAQMDYLAVGLAAMGGRTAVFNVQEFKKRMITNAYEGTTATSKILDEMPTKNLEAPMSANPTAIYLNNSYTNFFDAMMGQGTYFPPVGNGTPASRGLSYISGFENEFLLREASTSTAEAYYTFLKLPFAPDFYPEPSNPNLYYNTWINLPICVIPDKDFTSVLINGVANPYLPIKGYTYGAGGLAAVNFTDFDDVKAKQGVNYFIVSVSFDFQNSIPNNGASPCDANTCGDDFCAWDCDEDKSTTCNDCVGLDRYFLELTDVTVEKDVRVSGSNFQPLRENPFRGKYDISYSYAIFHCNGQEENGDRIMYDKWKRKELIIEHQDNAGNVTSTAAGARTPKAKTDHSHRLSQQFKWSGNTKSDDIYIMFYERDPRRKRIMDVNMNNNGHTAVTHMEYRSISDENPMGSKFPYSVSGDVEPLNNVWDHVVHIKASQFTATSPTTGEFHFNDTMDPLNRYHYGVSFTLKYFK